jgi:hypothetical protein
MGCFEKIWKDYLNQIPEKEREVINQNLDKLCQSVGKYLRISAQANVIAETQKKSRQYLRLLVRNHNEIKYDIKHSE